MRIGNIEAGNGGETHFDERGSFNRQRQVPTPHQGANRGNSQYHRVKNFDLFLFKI